MYDFLLDLRRIGNELRSEWGGPVGFLASVLIVASSSLSIGVKLWRGGRGLWRRKAGPAKDEEDFPEGA